MGDHSYQVAEAFGYMTLKEVTALKELASSFSNETDPPVFVNIGAGAGTSSLAMAEANPSADIYSVDNSPGGPYGGLEGERNAFHNAGFYPIPTQILGDSREVAKDWHTEIDLIFIDDGHLEHEIRADITSWMFHVKHGGIIVFHDYGKKCWPDVKKVVDELMSNFDKVVYVDTMIAFRKRVG